MITYKLGYGSFGPDQVPLVSTQGRVQGEKTAEARHAHVTNLTAELELEDLDLESFRSEGQRAGREREL